MKCELNTIQGTVSGDNPEIKDPITKLTEIGMEYLKDFCLLNKITVRGETISEIVTALIEDSIVN